MSRNATTAAPSRGTAVTMSSHRQAADQLRVPRPTVTASVRCDLRGPRRHGDRPPAFTALAAVAELPPGAAVEVLVDRTCPWPDERTVEVLRDSQAGRLWVTGPDPRVCRRWLEGLRGTAAGPLWGEEVLWRA